MGFVASGQGFGAYRVNEAEALRYLGYAGQELNQDLRGRLQDSMALCESTSRPGWAWKAFEVESDERGIRLAGSALVLPGNDIRTHLQAARYCAVITATCGLANERQMQALRAAGGLDALAFDAAGSSLVEVAADAAEADVVAWAHAKGLFTNYRYGPGYGDLPLTVQPILLRVLDADKILGVTATDANLLIPAKSITGLVGIFDTPPNSTRTCASCALAPHCSLREKGTPCFR